MKTFDNMYTRAQTPESQEQIVKEAVRAIAKEEQKEKWTQALVNDYGIQKKGKSKVSRTKILNIYTILSIAASILILALLAPQFYNNNKSLNEITLGYLKDSAISHPGVAKGVADSNQDIKIKAIAAFDAGQYAESTKYFSEITLMTTEDQFYLALSYLHTHQYPEAVDQFRSVLNQSNTYDQEVAWFLGLAFILNDDLLNAKNTLTKVKKGEWKYAEVQKLLKKLN